MAPALLTCWGTRKCRHTYRSTSRIRSVTAGLTLWGPQVRMLHSSLSVPQWFMEARRGPRQLLVQISHFQQPIRSIMLGLCKVLMMDKMLIQDVDMEEVLKTTVIKLRALTISNKTREEVSGDHPQITYVASVLKIPLLASKEQTHRLQTTFHLRIVHKTIRNLVHTYQIRTTMIRELVMRGKHTCWSTCRQEASVFHHHNHQPRYLPQTPTVSSLITISHLVIMNKEMAWTSFRVWLSEISCLLRRHRRTMNVNHSKPCLIRATTRWIMVILSSIESSLFEWAKT